MFNVGNSVGFEFEVAVGIWENVEKNLRRTRDQNYKF